MISLRDLIIKCNDRFLNWVLYRPLKGEKDPVKRFELKLWMEINGAFLSGMDSAMSWVKYKSYYYDKISSEDEKSQIRNLLLTMIKSDKYSISDKAKIVYVCGDLQIKDALKDIDELLLLSKDLSDSKLYRLASEALTRGIVMKQLIDEKFQKGERL